MAFSQTYDALSAGKIKCDLDFDFMYTWSSDSDSAKFS